MGILVIFHVQYWPLLLFSVLLSYRMLHENEKKNRLKRSMHIRNVCLTEQNSTLIERIEYYLPIICSELINDRESMKAKRPEQIKRTLTLTQSPHFMRRSLLTNSANTNELRS